MDYRERITSDADTHAAAINKVQTGLWTALPGIIQTTSLGKDGQLTSTVQPAIMSRVLQPDGSRKDVELPLLVDVPIVYPRGGPYTLTFPLSKDDEVLVIFASRCIDNWWATGGVQPQHELRFHDLSDGFAIPGPFSQKSKIANVSDKTVQLRTNDGKMYAEIDDPNKKLTLVTDVISLTLNYEAKTVVLTGSDTIDVTANTAVTIKAPTMTLDGNVKITGELTVQTTKFTTHRHTGVQTGLGTSGSPLPGS